MALTVKIRGDATHFEKTMRSVRGAASKLSDIIGKLAGGGALIGAAFLGTAAAGGLLSLKLAKIAEEGEKAENRLENIVKSMGLFGSESSKVAKRLGALADKTALLTGVDDDLILGTQAKLATFKELAKTAGTVGAAFDRATNAAVDMAAAGFGEATQNAVQLGKALNDPNKGINSLARAGITFTQSEKDLIKTLVESNQGLKAQDLILSAIEKQVGGTAVATARGTERIGVAISQLTEKMGGPFSKAVSGFADGFINQMPRMSSAIDGFSMTAEQKAAGLGMKMGKGLGIALADVVQGDFGIIVKTGNVIGQALLVGMQSAIGGGFVNSVIRPMMEWLEGGNMGGAAKERASAKVSGYLGERLSASELAMEGATQGEMAAAIQSLRDEIHSSQFGRKAEDRRVQELVKQRELTEKILQELQKEKPMFKR